MKRIVLTGAESSGKSTLTRHLARQFQLPHAQEYARIYLEKHGAHYDYAIVHQIAREHIAYQAEQVPDREELGIYDTDLLNLIIWCDVAFGGCEPWLREAAAAEKHHVYLLCRPDIPWEADPLREYPNGRNALFEEHLAEIISRGREYRVINGDGAARQKCAEDAVRELTSSS